MQIININFIIFVIIESQVIEREVIKVLFCAHVIPDSNLRFLPVFCQLHQLVSGDYRGRFTARICKYQ